MEQKLLNFISELISKAAGKGLQLLDEKPIGYGVQLKFGDAQNEIPVNVYFSQKKGISSVIGGSPQNPLRPLMYRLLNLQIEPKTDAHSWQVWVGTDESGKGDFFGPLVACGFLCNKAMLPTLQKLGVRDSKLIKDSEIVTIAKQLFARFLPNIETIVLMPPKYNQLYESFRSQNKKLNELLAWMHARIILNLHEKKQFEGAVVDKFASDRTLKTSLKDLKQVQILHKIRGEEDPAVAAASVIARYLFIKKMAELSQKYEMEFPKGASAKVVKMGKEYAAKYEKAKLAEVAKIHFKTFNEI